MWLDVGNGQQELSGGEDGGGFVGVVRILHSYPRARKSFNQIWDRIKSGFNGLKPWLCLT